MFVQYDGNFLPDHIMYGMVCMSSFPVTVVKQLFVQILLVV